MSRKLVNKIIKATDTVRELVIIYVSIVLISACLFAFFEHKPVLDSVWWASVTAMTIGYGDLYPVTLGGKMVAIALMHVVPLFVIPLITARMASKLIVNNDVFSHQEQEEIKKSLREIKLHLKIPNENSST